MDGRLTGRYGMVRSHVWCALTSTFIVALALVPSSRAGRPAATTTVERRPQWSRSHEMTSGLDAMVSAEGKLFLVTEQGNVVCFED